MQAHVAKIPGVEEDVAELKQDGKIIKAAVTGQSAELHEHDQRLNRLETDAA